jgi:predicted DNA-binding transcriptional regulator YafY
MILQARGQVTAEQLAEELEVSIRTIYRDVTALSAAGVPVFTLRGPGGGIALVESYRTDLTGLSKAEVRALFMLNIPAPLDELGVAGPLKTAMLKLAGALPASRRADERYTRQRVHLDWTSWDDQQHHRPHLATLHAAVWDERLLKIKYFGEGGEWIGPLETIVAPYGLVAKGGNWYLVAAKEDHKLVIRASGVLEAITLEAKFQRQADFDLATFWRDWLADYEARRPTYPVQVRVSPRLSRVLHYTFGDNIKAQIDAGGPPDEAGWLRLSLLFESLEDARGQLLPLGSAVEVLAPLALRMSLLDFAKQLVSRYE